MATADDPRAAGTPPFARVCVFCGSKAGRDPEFLASAIELGAVVAERGIHLVYGGGSSGLMGAVATAVLDAGGDVTGVLPTGLFPDGVTASPLRDDHLGTLVIEEVEDMHARKARFHALADAYVVLPGGIGTLEEAAEVATWGQIGIHENPIGFLDVGGYYGPLLRWFDRAVDDGFLPATTRDRLHVGSEPSALLDAMAAGVGPSAAEAPAQPVPES